MVRKSKLIWKLGRHLNAENYLTNSLIATIDELMPGDLSEADRQVALDILNLIARTDEDPEFDEDTDIIIEPQKPLGGGRQDSEGQPDVTLSSMLPGGSRRRVLIEVKDECDVTDGQLVRYKHSLARNRANPKHVILLCWPDTQIEEADENATDRKVYWQQVTQRIRASVSEDQSETGLHLVGSLLHYMEEEKGMVLEKVNDKLPSEPAFDNLVNLLDMLKVALTPAGFRNARLYQETEAESDGDPANLGFYASYHGKKFWAGIYAKHPHTVALTVQDEALGWDTEELNLAEDGVLALDAAAQMRRIEGFLSTSAKEILKRNSKGKARQQRKTH